MTPFVVVGMPRTGSTLLSTGLDQHTSIKCFGELFHPVYTERSGAHALRINGDLVFFDPINDDALQFLGKWVFSDMMHKFGAVGFKLFGEYVTGPGSAKLFARLKDRSPQLSFIHISRENYLDVLVSREVARATKQWVVLANDRKEPKVPKTLYIKPDMAERFFSSMQQMDRFYGSYFAGEYYHRVTYKDLDNSYDSTMNAAYAFLGLPPHPAKPEIVRQRTKNNPEMVENFDDLRRRFVGTEYANFFA